MKAKNAQNTVKSPKNTAVGEAIAEASLLDHSLSRLHRLLFGRRPWLPLLASVLVYAFVVLAFGERLAISSNYFVILPVLASALAYRLPGGLLAGALGLPANLLLFSIIGHPEYSPASKPIAEASGLVVGSAFGYLADYFRALEAEIARRRAAEASLREALAARDLLLHEVHHRVKNNLNVIKSLVQLQRNRSSDRGFIKAAEELIGRIFAIALIHDQLYAEDADPAIDPEGYLSALIERIARREAESRFRFELRVETGGSRLSPDTATSLGLVFNEILSNAARHAFEGVAEPLVEIEFELKDDRYRLSVRDNGRGFPPGDASIEGLGLKIVRALSQQLGGEPSFGPAPEGGSLFELSFPANEALPAKGEAPGGQSSSPST